MSIGEYIIQLQTLTQRNLEILNAINQSFLTKSEHLKVDINGSSLILPSYLALENKLNMLEDNFENLVNAPKTGEAAFDFNGNTQHIEVVGFSNVPAKALNNVQENQYLTFNYENNEVFKDFCTPKPYIKIELNSIPSHIQQINVKKVIIPTQSPALPIILDRLGESNVSVPFEYSELIKLLYQYDKGSDYIEYDKKYDLPIRDSIGYGKYEILSIEKNWTDDNLDEHYILKLNNINYYIKDETIQKQLSIGDYLVTNNDRCKLYVEDVKVLTNTVTVKVMNNSYLDLVTVADGNEQLYTLKYMSNQSFDAFKYVNVPIEEDRYVFVFVAPIERNSLIQAPWGTGILFDVDRMYCNVGDNIYYFRDYYNKFVTNIGDTMVGLVDLFGQSFVNFTEDKFNQLTKAQPVIDVDALKVVQINKHLNSALTVANIFKLYQQKQEQKNQLRNIRSEIDNITSILSSTSFQDTQNNRTIYEQQLLSLNNQKREITSNITSIINEINVAVTDTDTPIDNPKYHIRGFFDFESFLNENNIGYDIAKIDVQYRYKNESVAVGSASTITGNDIYTDWNTMDSIWNRRVAVFDGKIIYKTIDDTTNKNEVSFNQFDIPISQGESVDIRMRVIYSVGQPFVDTYSDWSDIVNIPFPEEFKQSVTILDIVNENNDDAKKDAFKSILTKEGIIEHNDDKVIDQNLIYFHKPESIASGFYTDERRIIPLSDMLKEMNNTIIQLRDEIHGTETEELEVSISDDNHITQCVSGVPNVHELLSYSTAKQDGKDTVEQNMLITLTNSSQHIVKLYSLFPGSNDVTIQSLGNPKYPVRDYVIDSSSPKKLYPKWYDSKLSTDKFLPTNEPYANQLLYFRVKDVYTNNSYLYYANETNANPTEGCELLIYPICNNKQDIFLEGNRYAYKTLNPGESIYIPLVVRYRDLPSNIDSKKFAFGFDIRTSLYRDPLPYIVHLQLNKESNIQSIMRIPKTTSKYDPSVIRVNNKQKGTIATNRIQ